MQLKTGSVDMAEFAEKLGLGFLFRDEGMVQRVVGHVVQNGSAVTGYYGSLYFDEHNFEYANQYFELINKEFPEDADATYFFLAYGYYHQQESASFMHYLAKIRKEIPDMYATMGTGDTILMTDTYFNEALRAIKEDVSTGKINLNKYL